MATTMCPSNAPSKLARAALCVLPMIALALGCRAEAQPADGDAVIAGSVSDLTLDAEHGYSIADSTPPAMQIVVSPSPLGYGVKGGAERLIIDIARQQKGVFVVVPGHPYVSFLGDDQARAAVCPAGDPGNQPPCHEGVKGGTVQIDRIDDVGGRVEGSFHIDLSDGSVSGTFSAARCS
jgi:hypothetical protein